MMELSTYSVGLPQYGQIFPDVILFIGFCFCLYVGQAGLEPASCATAGDVTAVLTLRNTARVVPAVPLYRATVAYLGLGLRG